MPGAGATASGPAADSVEHHNALPIGTRIGEFEIAALIGIGGFGIVYLALDHSLDRKVALKEYMPSALAQRDPAASSVVVKSQRHAETFDAGMRSFINEARLLAQFDHPSLVKVYRFWEQNGTAYMVMPFYEGLTLKETLRRRGVAPEELWLESLLSQLLDALEIIHARQCYHRDIAPDNILMLPGDTPLLLDFGAARRVIGDMTQALTVILKPGYAPIEQYAEAPNMRQGPWTDIYALASVVYFAIVGRPPVPSVARVMSDPLEPLAVNAAGRYSDTFLRAIDSALAVRPEDRPQDVAAFRRALGFSAREALTRFLPGRVDESGLQESTFDASRAVRTVPPRPVTANAPSVSQPAAPATTVAASDSPGKRKPYVLGATLVGVLALGGAGYYFARDTLFAPSPVSPPSIAATPANQTVAEIAGKLAGFDCALLEASMNGSTAVIRGHVGGEADLKRIDTDVGTVAGVQDVDYSAVRVYPRPYCSVVTALATHTRHAPAAGAPGIALKGGVGEAFAGETLAVEVVAPSFDAFVYADLYDPEANVVHLLPNSGQAGNRMTAGQRVVLGDDPLSGGRWEVVPPLGKHMLVVMASESRLFERERPQVEDVFGYLRAVRDGVAAKPAGSRLVVYYSMVDFLPKR